MPATIYTNGPIYPMTAEGARVEALAVEDGRIAAVGRRTEVFEAAGPDPLVVDLAGRTLLPGFIDPHSHLVLQSYKLAVVNLDPHPIGDIRTIDDVERTLADHIEEVEPAPGTWVFGWGYDDTGLEEMRHPTRDDLDRVSTDHPIALLHISAHLMTCNSRALEVAGIDADTPDPNGGRIRRRPGTTEPTGVLEELAMAGVLMSIPQPPPERSKAMLRRGLGKYAEAGITTAQDGASSREMLAVLADANASGDLPIDVVAYPMYSLVDDALLADIAAGWRARGRFRVGGVKITIDGSIQGYTAFLGDPYHVQPGGADLQGCDCDSEAGARMVLGADESGPGPSAAPTPPEPAGDHRGYPSMPQEAVTQWLATCDAAGIPLLCHCNGDAAVDMLLEAVGAVRTGGTRPDLRTVIIHAQTIRDDQLDVAAAQGLVPSFFPIHVPFWGDRHRDIFLGPERAARISPARSALDRGMRITLHHDAPVAGISMLGVVSAAVNRRTTGGTVLGPEEAITPYEAIRAITADAAWQYFEEDRKGTLEEGKLADLVILSGDPFTIDPEAIADLAVVQTIKEGTTVFEAADG